MRLSTALLPVLLSAPAASLQVLSPSACVRVLPALLLLRPLSASLRMRPGDGGQLSDSGRFGGVPPDRNPACAGMPRLK